MGFIQKKRFVQSNFKYMFNKIIKYFLSNRLITIMLLIVIIVWGISTAPFNWNSLLPRDPIPVDAIPDLGDNQQIVSTEWMGRSPKDIQERLPITDHLPGNTGCKNVRSTSCSACHSSISFSKKS